VSDMPTTCPRPRSFGRRCHVDREFADARRTVGVCAHDNQALGAVMAEIHRSGRAMNVLAAMAVLALDFADLSADARRRCPEVLDGSVMAQDTPRPSGATPNSARGIAFRPFRPG